MMMVRRGETISPHRCSAQTLPPYIWCQQHGHHHQLRYTLIWHTKNYLQHTDTGQNVRTLTVHSTRTGPPGSRDQPLHHTHPLLCTTDRAVGSSGACKPVEAAVFQPQRCFCTHILIVLADPRHRSTPNRCSLHPCQSSYLIPSQVAGCPPQTQPARIGRFSTDPWLDPFYRLLLAPAVTVSRFRICSSPKVQLISHFSPSLGAPRTIQTFLRIYRKPSRASRSRQFQAEAAAPLWPLRTRLFFVA